MMKRQRGTASGVGVTNLNPSKEIPTMVAMQGKKKPKREIEKVKDESAEEERNENRDMGLLETEDNMMDWTCNLEENWPGAWLQSEFVDEQMSWGSVWCPIWDLDFNAEAFGALYSDVLWDDDIWNLKKEIPNPSESSLKCLRSLSKCKATVRKTKKKPTTTTKKGKSEAWEHVGKETDALHLAR